MENKSVCFSGHRPEKLPDNGDEFSPKTALIKSILHKQITDCIDEGYNRFITGLARGIDNWAADIIIDLKLKGSKITLLCVKPYENYGEKWSGFDKWNLSHILEKSDEIISVSDLYTKDCMKKRNTFMVDNSQRLIAFVSNYYSGTGQTIRYAQKKELDVRVFDLSKIL